MKIVDIKIPGKLSRKEEDLRESFLRQLEAIPNSEKIAFNITGIWRIFNPDNIFTIMRQFGNRIRFNIHSGAAGNIIKNNRNFYGLGNGFKMLI